MARLYERGGRLGKTVDLLHRSGGDPEPLENDGRSLDADPETLARIRMRARARRFQAAAAAVATGGASPPAESGEGAEEPSATLPEGAAAPRSPSQVEPPKAAHSPSPKLPDLSPAEGEAPRGEGRLSASDRLAAQMLAERRKRDPELADIRQEQVVLGLKRFSMIVDRLEQAKAAADNQEWAPHLLTAAAQIAKDHREFSGYLQRLKRLGLEDLHMEQVFRAMTERMPNWYLAPDSAARTQTAATAAMERLVDLPKTRRRGRDGWRRSSPPPSSISTGGHSDAP